jgi:hypothetical protein
MFAVEQFDAEYESFRGDGTSRWSPCTVIGVAMDNGEAKYVARALGGTLESLVVIDYLKTPKPFFPRRPSA